MKSVQQEYYYHTCGEGMETTREKYRRLNFYLRTVALIILFNLLVMLTCFAQLMTNNNISITISPATQLTVQGSVQSNAGTQISNSGTIDLSGDWINNTGGNCFSTSQGTVILNGAAQNISGTNTTLFNNLTLSGSGIKTIVLNTIVGGSAGAGILDVGNMTLDLNGQNLSLTNPAGSGIAYLAGMIYSEKPDNSSNLTWMIGNTNGPHTIPFGNLSGIQIPFTIDLTSGNIGNVTVATYNTAQNNTPYPVVPTLVTQVNDQNGVDNSANMVDRFWEIDNTGGGGTADLTFTYAPSEIAANGNVNQRAQRWDSPALGWDLPTGGQFNPTALSVTTPGISTFGAWALTQESSPLPITLLSFNALVNNKKQVDLTWATLSEINNDYFVVEKSQDGITFIPVVEIDGAGNSTTELHYATIDAHPFHGLSYYRLKQVDFDGMFAYSETKSVIIKDSGHHDVFVYPNPATSYTYILFDEQPENSGDVRFDLFDATGKKVVTIDLSQLENISGNSFRFGRATLADGIYFYSVTSKENVIGRGMITFQ